MPDPIKVPIEPELKPIKGEDLQRYKEQLKDLHDENPLDILEDKETFDKLPSGIQNWINVLTEAISSRQSHIKSMLSDAFDGKAFSQDMIKGLEQGFGFLEGNIKTLASATKVFKDIFASIPHDMAKDFSRELTDMSKTASDILSKTTRRLGPMTDAAMVETLKRNQGFSAGSSAFAGQFQLSPQIMDQLTKSIVKIAVPTNMRADYYDSVIHGSNGTIKRHKIAPGFDTYKDRLPEVFRDLPDNPELVKYGDVSKKGKYKQKMSPEDYTVVQNLARTNPAWEQALIMAGAAKRGQWIDANGRTQAGRLIMPKEMTYGKYAQAVGHLYKDILQPSLMGAPAWRKDLNNPDEYVQSNIANKTTRTPTESYAAFNALQGIPVRPIFTAAQRTPVYRYKDGNSVGLESDVNIRPDLYQIQSLTYDDFRAGRILDATARKQHLGDDSAAGESVNKIISESMYTHALGMHGHNTFGNGSVTDNSRPKTMQIDLTDRILKKDKNGDLVYDKKTGNPEGDEEALKLVEEMFTPNKTLKTKNGKTFNYPSVSFGEGKNAITYVPTGIDSKGRINVAEEKAYLDATMPFVEKWGVGLFENLMSMDEEFSTVKGINKPISARNTQRTPAVPFSKLGGSLPSKDKIGMVDLSFMGLDGALLAKPGYLPAKGLTVRGVGLKGSGASVDLVSMIKQLYGDDIKDFRVPAWGAPDEMKQLFKDKDINAVREAYKDPEYIKKIGGHSFDEDFVDMFKYDMWIDKSLDKAAFYKGRPHSQIQELFADVLDMTGGLYAVKSDKEFLSESDTLSSQVTQNLKLTPEQAAANREKWQNHINKLRTDPEYGIKHLFSDPDDPLSKLLKDNKELYFTDNEARARVADAVASAEDSQRRNKMFTKDQIAIPLALPNPASIAMAIGAKNGAQIKNEELAEILGLGTDEQGRDRVAFGLEGWNNVFELGGWRWPNNLGEQFTLVNDPRYVEKLKEFGMSTNALWLNMPTIARMGGGDVDGDTVGLARGELAEIMKATYQDIGQEVERRKQINKDTGKALQEDLPLEGGKRKVVPRDFADTLYRKAAATLQMAAINNANEGLAQEDMNDEEWKKYAVRAGTDLKALYDIDSTYAKTGVLGQWSKYAKTAKRMGTPFARIFKGLQGAVETGEWDKVKDFSKVNFPSRYSALTMNMLKSWGENPYSDEALQRFIARQEDLQGISGEQTNPIDQARAEYLRLNNRIMGDIVTGRAQIVSEADEDALKGALGHWSELVQTKMDEGGLSDEDKERYKKYQREIDQQNSRMSHLDQFGNTEKAAREKSGYFGIKGFGIDDFRLSGRPGAFDAAYNAAQDAVRARMNVVQGASPQVIQMTQKAADNARIAANKDAVENARYSWSRNHTIERDNAGGVKWYNTYVKHEKQPKTPEMVIGDAEHAALASWARRRMVKDDDYGTAEEYEKAVNDYILSAIDPVSKKNVFDHLPQEGEKHYEKYKAALETARRLPELLKDHRIEGSEVRVVPNMGYKSDGTPVDSVGFIDVVTSKLNDANERDLYEWDLKSLLHYEENAVAGTGALDQVALYSGGTIANHEDNNQGNLSPFLKSKIGQKVGNKYIGIISYGKGEEGATRFIPVTPEHVASVEARMAKITQAQMNVMSQDDPYHAIVNGAFSDVVLPGAGHKAPIYAKQRDGEGSDENVSGGFNYDRFIRKYFGSLAMKEEFDRYDQAESKLRAMQNAIGKADEPFTKYDKFERMFNEDSYTNARSRLKEMGASDTEIAEFNDKFKDGQKQFLATIRASAAGDLQNFIGENDIDTYFTKTSRSSEKLISDHIKFDERYEQARAAYDKLEKIAEEDPTEENKAALEAAEKVKNEAEAQVEEFNRRFAEKGESIARQDVKSLIQKTHGKDESISDKIINKAEQFREEREVVLNSLEYLNTNGDLSDDVYEELKSTIEQDADLNKYLDSIITDGKDKLGITPKSVSKKVDEWLAQRLPYVDGSLQANVAESSMIKAQKELENARSSGDQDKIAAAEAAAQKATQDYLSALENQGKPNEEVDVLRARAEEMKRASLAEARLGSRRSLLSFESEYTGQPISAADEASLKAEEYNERVRQRRAELEEKIKTEDDSATKHMYQQELDYLNRLNLNQTEDRFLGNANARQNVRNYNLARGETSLNRLFNGNGQLSVEDRVEDEVAAAQNKIEEHIAYAKMSDEAAQAFRAQYDPTALRARLTEEYTMDAQQKATAYRKTAASLYQKYSPFQLNPNQEAGLEATAAQNELADQRRQISQRLEHAHGRERKDLRKALRLLGQIDDDTIYQEALTEANDRRQDEVDQGIVQSEQNMMNLRQARGAIDPAEQGHVQAEVMRARNAQRARYLQRQLRKQNLNDEYRRSMQSELDAINNFNYRDYEESITDEARSDQRIRNISNDMQGEKLDATIAGRGLTRDDLINQRRAQLEIAVQQHAKELRKGGQRREAAEYLRTHDANAIEEAARRQVDNQYDVAQVQRENQMADAMSQIEAQAESRQWANQDFWRQRSQMRDTTAFARNYNAYANRALQLQRSSSQYQRHNERLERQNNLIDERLQNGELSETDRLALQNQRDINSQQMEANTQAMADANREARSLTGVNGMLGASLDTVSQAVTRFAQRFGRQMFQKALQETKRFVQEFDASMTEIQAITLKSDGEMQDVRKGTLSKAIKMRTSVSNVASTEAALYRQGLSDAEVSDRTNAIIKFATVAKIKTEEATKIVTTALQNDLVDNATQAMDVLVALGDNAATTAAEIGKGMQKAAASAKVAGVSYGELTSLLTIGTSDTQLSGTQVGTALQTVFTRMRKMSLQGWAEDQSGEKTSASDADAALQSIGVELFEDRQNGVMRSSYDVLRDVASVWGTLSDVQKSVVTNALAGTRQTNIFSTLMEGMSEDGGKRMDEILGLTENSSGVTQSKYEIAMESIAASMDTFRSSYDLLVESFTDNGVITGAIDGLSGFFQMLAGISEGGGNIGMVLSAVAAGIAAIVTTVAIANASIPGLSAVSGLLTIVGALAAGGVGVALTKLFTPTPEKTTQEKAEEARESMQRRAEARRGVLSNQLDAIDNVKKLGKAYDDLKDSTDELAKAEASQALRDALLDLAKAFPSLSEEVLNSLNDLANWENVVKGAENTANNVSKKASREGRRDAGSTWANEGYEAYSEEYDENDGEESLYNLRMAFTDGSMSTMSGGISKGDAEWLKGQKSKGNDNVREKKLKVLKNVYDHEDLTKDAIEGTPELGAFFALMKDVYEKGQGELTDDEVDEAFGLLYDKAWDDNADKVVAQERTIGRYNTTKSYLKQLPEDVEASGGFDFLYGRASDEISKDMIKQALWRELESELYDESGELKSDYKYSYGENIGKINPNAVEGAYGAIINRYEEDSDLEKTVRGTLKAEDYPYTLTDDEGRFVRGSADLQSLIKYAEEHNYSTLNIRNKDRTNVFRSGEQVVQSSLLAGQTNKQPSRDFFKTAREINAGGNGTIKGLLEAYNGKPSSDLEAVMKQNPLLTALFAMGTVTKEEEEKGIKPFITDAQFFSALSNAETGKLKPMDIYELAMSAVREKPNFAQELLGNENLSPVKSILSNILGEDVMTDVLTNASNGVVDENLNAYVEQKLRMNQYGLTETPFEYKYAGLGILESQMANGTLDQFMTGANKSMVDDWLSYSDSAREYFDIGRRLEQKGLSMDDVTAENADKINEALKDTGYSYEQAAEAAKKYNTETSGKHITDQKKYGESTEFVAEMVQSIGQGGKKASAAMGTFRGEVMKLSNAMVAIEKSKGKSGKQLGQKEKQFLSAVTGIDVDQIKDMSKEEIEDLTKTAEDIVKNDWVNQIGGTIEQVLENEMETKHISLGDLVAFDADSSGSLDLTELAAAAQQLGLDATAILASYAGKVGELQLEVDKEGNTVAASIKLAGGSLNGGGNYHGGGGGGGGGGKSAIDKMLEGQKHKVTEAEHNVKMIQIQEDVYKSNGDYWKYLRSLREEIAAQNKLKQVYAENIKELEKQRGMVQYGSDDWYKLTEALYSAKEAMAQISKSIDDINSKRIDALAGKMEDRKNQFSHTSTMLDKRAQIAMERGRFKDYAALITRENSVDTKAMEANQKNIDTWTKELEKYKKGSEAWKKVRENIYKAMEENADYELQILQRENQLNQERVNQIAANLTNKNATAVHQGNVASTYAQAYQNMGQYGMYRDALQRAYSSNNSQRPAIQRAIKDLKSLMSTLDDSSEAWYNARDQLYQYEEQLAELDVSALDILNSIEESYVLEVSDKYEDINKRNEHEMKMLQLAEAKYDSNDDFANYMKVIEEQASFTEKRIQSTSKELAEYYDLLNSGNITRGSKAWDELMDKIMSTEESLAQYNNDYDELIRKSQQSKFDHIVERFNRYDALDQHQLKMVQYEESMYKNRNELTNYNTLLGIDNELQAERADRLRDYIKLLKEEISTVEPGTDLYFKMNTELYKAEETLAQLNNTIENNTELMKKNQEAILKTRKTVEDTINKEIKTRIQEEKEKLSATASVENSIIELIRKRYLDEWALVKRDIEEKKKALNKEKELINERLNARKEAVDQESKLEKLAELQRQLALIESDPTRTKEAKALRKQFEDLQKETSMNIAEQEAKALTDAIDDQVNSLTEYQTDFEARLNDALQDANSALIADELDQIMSGKYEDYVDWMKQYNEAFQNATETSRELMIQGWEDSWKKMKGIIDTYWNKVDDIMSSQDKFIEYMTSSTRYLSESSTGQQIMLGQFNDMFEDMVAALKDDATYEHVHEILEKITEAQDWTYKVELPSEIGQYLKEIAVSTVYSQYKDTFHSGDVSTWTKEAWESYSDIHAQLDATSGGSSSGSSGGSGGGSGGSGESSSQTGKKKWSIKFENGRYVAYEYANGQYATQAEAQAQADVLNRNLNQAGVPTPTNGNTTPVASAYGNGLKYATGGLVDYTGPAWVDGTPSRPEAFLNAEDTATVRAMIDAMNYIRVNPFMSNIGSEMFGGNSVGDINITINEADLGSDADIDDVARKVGSAFVKELSHQGLHLANYSF